MHKGALAPAGSVLLALIASQHHSLHMVLLTFGVGTAGISLFMNPLTRRLMLLLSVVAVTITMYQFWYQRRPLAMRIAGSLSILVTIILLAWSISQFGV